MSLKELGRKQLLTILRYYLATHLMGLRSNARTHTYAYTHTKHSVMIESGLAEVQIWHLLNTRKT
jgi:hypothetical protein